MPQAVEDCKHVRGPSPTVDGEAEVRRVCLDGRGLDWPEGTGVTLYARSIADGLPALGWATDTLRAGAPTGVWRNRLCAVWPGATRAATAGTDWEARDAFRRAQVYFDVQRRLLTLRGTTRPRLMHWTYPVPLVFRGAPNVYTVHDTIPLTHPALTGIHPARFARLLRAIFARADHILTVSDASRRDILALGLDPSRVTTTGQPVGVTVPAAPPEQRGHLLFCGTIERRKNISRLIAAYRASGSARPLILAGPDGFGAAAELSGGEIHPLSAMPRGGAPGDALGVWRAPFLPRADLLDLMRGARAVLLPSLAEGFGRPIIEAMALGVPVLTSAGGATEEVAGGAALLVDPHDTGSIAQGVAALSENDALCRHLVAEGLRRASLFTPEAILGRLTAVYDRFAQAAP